MDYSFLNDNKLVPVVVLERAEDALPLLGALRDGGIKVAEITFRTACAREAIELACANIKDMLVGAGTVINAGQCAQAISAGAKFVVSPGFSAEVAEVCKRADVPYLPGVATATEVMAAKACGFDILKFFPAGAMGGVKTLKAIAAAFPDVRFLPTGGVNAENMKEYLALDCVVAVGGSWMVKKDVESTLRLSREATEALK